GSVPLPLSTRNVCELDEGSVKSVALGHSTAGTTGTVPRVSPGCRRLWMSWAGRNRTARGPRGQRGAIEPMREQQATNITRHNGHVTREERSALLAQHGATLWFTGLSGSGKSTTAFTLEHALVQRGRLAYVLDGDNIRHGLNRNLGFSAADREENIRRIGEVAKLFAD